MSYSKTDFGKDFHWGTATASYQVEGAYQTDGRGMSIWDTLSHISGKVKNNDTGDVACDFYNRYESDLEIMKSMNFNAFRFSISWSRILPEGTGKINPKGIEFYHKLIDKCLSLGITPFITIYHWDLPQTLEDKGGWTNREILNWFAEYTEILTKEYGAKVKNWMILNEPVIFGGFGYLMGHFAPQRKGLENFLPAVHHISMVMGVAGRIVRKNVEKAIVGTTFSCGVIDPLKDTKEDKQGAAAQDAYWNRMFIEPVLGLGYPKETLKWLEGIDKYVQEGDMEKLPFDFDFVGVQNYSRMVVTHDPNDKLFGSRGVDLKKELKINEKDITSIGWEVYPEGIYRILKQYGAYKNVKQIIVTENGAAGNDKESKNGEVNDPQRVKYYKEYLKNVLKAKKEGVNVGGYFAWSYMDNFEWMEGYSQRFGIVYVDYPTQKRIIKDSGKWFKEFLK
ncbi:MAG: beta-glucosidase [Bacteroidetes bacterium]|nr:MAG: beta-glucosidase [Bacteroidota bacterium]